MLGDERYVEVRYEALLERPVPEVRASAAFLGADDGDEAAKAVRGGGVVHPLDEGHGRRGTRTQTRCCARASPATGRTCSRPRTGEIYDRHAGELLVELGYETDRDWV